MSIAVWYSLVGVALFSQGVYGLIIHGHLLRKILAANIMSSGVFLVFVATALRNPQQVPDPVPHAMVLTGIVVAFSATALGLALAAHLQSATGRADIDQDEAP